VYKAIAGTLPSVEGQRHRCIFRLARHLKGIPSLQNADAKTVRPYVEQWHQLALPVIGTKPFIETWADFVVAWKRVRIPAGQGVIETAFQRAKASTPPAMIVNLYGGGEIVLLAALCWELQRIAGDKEFYLDCRTAGRLIGVGHVTAWRYLEVLKTDGILTAGVKGSKATRKASTFRFAILES